MNKSQFASIGRYVSIIAGVILAQHKFTNSDLIAAWVQRLVELITIAGPILWSLWSKTHAAQAQKAIDLVNTIEGVIGSADDGTVRLAPGASPKPPATGLITPLALILLCLVPAVTFSGCQGTTALVVTTQTVKAVGQTAETAVMTSAKLYGSGQISAAQARAVNDFFDNKFQPAFRVAAAGIETGVAPAPASLIDLAGQLSALVASYQKPTP